ncbi:hypothetical protein ES703_69403 [subsurface metagenome]
MDTTRVRIILLNIVLLDADVIMDMHRFNIWDEIVAKNKTYISSIILRQEYIIMKTIMELNIILIYLKMWNQDSRKFLFLLMN